ncbi:hypothetical protein FHS21_001927 [Phyllobacterium trifolii]|jgi:hypothetical protein|uniref:Uncharacterized protein n=1 Tax=Phyllobacterium trifolii TaxID=300193 RepID=A0A839U691_9HYPH|nr:hypothetical protein [Phyllobacterium trifolii]MBB3145515.1 hypothetical protein [Phyllobacterium trifolii]
MSMEYWVHLNEISDDIIPDMISELNKFEMTCEIYPGFSFSKHSGFLPFKFRLSNPKLDILKNKDLVSGFELYVEDFEPEDADWFSPEDLARLSEFKKTVSIRFAASDSFQLRFADLTSAVIAKLTGGPRSFDEDVDYDTSTIADKSWEDLKHWENSIADDDWRYYEFQGWH